ncbi:hypothetical protein DRN73_02365 [Candidatus Pacearchaeota archaeon]|nr:MAG: hypothetical protein DRN73_02365 [Candidatus Pacearchaeota archaeon]
MFEILASYGYYGGGAIGSFFDMLASQGFFSYLLPFLLIFSIVYGILLKLDFFKNNKSINAIIALAVGLMALQFDYVPAFFSDIFPRVGIGLAIILVILIILGLFLPNKDWAAYILFGVGILITLYIIFSTEGFFGFFSSNIGYWLSYNWPLIAGLVFIIIVIAVIVGAGKPPRTPKPLSDVLPQLFGLNTSS